MGNLAKFWESISSRNFSWEMGKKIQNHNLRAKILIFPLEYAIHPWEDWRKTVLMIIIMILRVCSAGGNCPGIEGGLIISPNQLLRTYCRAATIKPFNTTSNILTVIFSSDASITSSGFRASWRRIEIKETSGIITSPNYPNLQTEGNLFQRVGVLNGPKDSNFLLHNMHGYRLRL